MEEALHNLERKYLYSEYPIEDFQPEEKGNVVELFCVGCARNHSPKEGFCGVSRNPDVHGG